jgi:hypothetical protein
MRPFPLILQNKPVFISEHTGSLNTRSVIFTITVYANGAQYVYSFPVRLVPLLTCRAVAFRSTACIHIGHYRCMVWMMHTKGKGGANICTPYYLSECTNPFF